MSGFYNPSTPETLGLEWLIDTEPGSVVLDSATRGFGQVFSGAALKVAESFGAYATALSGLGTFGLEAYSAPYTESIPQTYETDYAGTDTGAEFNSPYNGNAAWLDAGGGVASYADVSPGVDDTTYLKNVNQVEGPVPARLLMRGANANQMAGKRVLSVEVWARIKSTLDTSPSVAGTLRIGSTDYVAQNAVVATKVGYSEFQIGYWELNPSTLLPWTLPQVNNLITTGGTDSFGFLSTWNASYTSSYADTIRVAKVYLKVRWQPEDRAGYAAGAVSATGWQTWTAKSVPNLLTAQDANLEINTATTGGWVAGPNTTLTNDADDRGAPWTRSLKITSVASGAASALSGFYPCIAGKTYSFRSYAKVTSGRTVTHSILFYDANGNLLQQSASAGDTGTGSYAAVGMTAIATAPLGATQMKAWIVLTATAGSQTCFTLQNTLTLDRAAINMVRSSYPGALAVIKFDGAAEVSWVSHPTDELVVWRRINGTGVMSMPLLPAGSSTVGMPLGQFSRRTILQDGAGAILNQGTEDTPVTAHVATSLSTYDSAEGPTSAYSQPYALRVPGAVHTGNTILSEMTLPAATFVAFRLVVAGQVDVPGAALSLKLKRVSDNVQAGGTATIAPTDLTQIIPPGGGAASRTTPQVFVVAIPTPAANTAVQYYVEASSTAAAGSGWVLYALDDVGYSGDSVAASTITFGANVDAWNDPLNGGELTRRNGMVTVQTKPAAPSGLAAAIVGQVVSLTWTPSALGATFAAYELWRLNDRAGIDSDGWQQIADLTTEAVGAYLDPESRRGVNAQYKIRTRRTDGSLSDFSSPTVGRVTPTTGYELLFVSAEMDLAAYVGAMNCTDQEWRPPSDVVIREFAGRDGAVAFLPIENALDEWERELLLYWKGNNLAYASPVQDPPVIGRAAFNALETLCRASISYVCVLDRHGNRWFANVVPVSLRKTQQGGYFAKVHVRELQRVPSTPTSSPA